VRFVLDPLELLADRITRGRIRERERGHGEPQRCGVRPLGTVLVEVEVGPPGGAGHATELLREHDQAWPLSGAAHCEGSGRIARGVRDLFNHGLFGAKLDDRGFFVVPGGAIPLAQDLDAESEDAVELAQKVGQLPPRVGAASDGERHRLTPTADPGEVASKVASMQIDLSRMLVCPRDRSELELRGAWLRCRHDHEFAVVDGVPVMLDDAATPTIGIARDSLLRARDPEHTDARAPELFLESLGISEQEKTGVVGLRTRGSAIDPVVSYLVAATNGLMYVPWIGKLERYPIPELRLPPAKGELLLDVGCSWGRWSMAAARKGYRVIGIDPSLGAVMAARRVARQLGLDAQFVVGDARALPFGDRVFAAVFSYSVLQHFAKSDVRAALGEMGRVLAPSGASLVQMANAAGVRSVQHQARRRFRTAEAFEVRYWLLPELRAAFERAIGPSAIEVDGFFGLGMQPSDAPYMSRFRRTVLSASTALTAMSQRLPALRWVADSVYVRSLARD
jgi:SAM-dependent methyltransferase/uncharacterized protein YbaR (Trm112 family)